MTNKSYSQLTAWQLLLTLDWGKGREKGQCRKTEIFQIKYNKNRSNHLDLWETQLWNVTELSIQVHFDNLNIFRVKSDQLRKVFFSQVSKTGFLIEVESEILNPEAAYRSDHIVRQFDDLVQEITTHWKRETARGAWKNRKVGRFLGVIHYILSH